jgi:natural product biosynthesis luciferase-like monooxygenase protein/amino acid adenylation domain-containing protein
MTQSAPNELNPLQKAYSAIKLLREQLDRAKNEFHEPIAIIGMSCRAPGASNADDLWQLVRNAEDAITDIPASRWDAKAYYDPKPGTPGKAYTLKGGFVDHVDQFDAGFFNISAREAEGMDPQQRLLLEVTWEALENAGIPASSLVSSPTGVFIGVTSSDYGLLQADANQEKEVNPYFNTGTPLNACAGRISYVLGLQGPSIAIDTACSSSLTAIHLACNALHSKDCEIALTGGVNLTLAPLLNVTLSAAGMMSADGKCKTFSEEADGYVRGEGCGIVVLKRLSDAQSAGDSILAVIRATGVNQDGASSGFTVPNGIAQQKLIQQTLDKAGISSLEIDYVEAHGTGTPLGDPIEAQSLGNVIGTANGRDRPLLVGSLKSNIGHLESAAGVMGLIKLVKALEYQELPPTLHITKPSTRIPWKDLNLEPISSLRPWLTTGNLRRAGLSAFGASGSNAHLVLEEAPLAIPEKDHAHNYENRSQVLAISAKNKDALIQLAQSYFKLANHSDYSLADLCFNANTRRDHLKVRAAFCAKNISELSNQIQKLTSDEKPAGVFLSQDNVKKTPKIAFVFSGQGSVYAGMAKDLYQQQAVFRQALDTCINVIEKISSKNILESIFASDSAESQRFFSQAQNAQPCLFSIQYALSQLWISLGIKPSAVIGHSLGEYAAACIAGILSLEDALKLVIERGRLTDTLRNPGSMAIVFSSLEKIEPLIQAHAKNLSIAVINAKENIVVSGNQSSLDSLLEQCQTLGIETYPLTVTHAFHSPLLEPILDQFNDFAKTIPSSKAQLPFISCLTGELIQSHEQIGAEYWRNHYRNTVDFAKGLRSLEALKPDLIIEISPNPILANLGKAQLALQDWLPSLQQYKDDSLVVASTLARLYALGLDIHWKAFEFGSNQRISELPTYPFQRKSYWISKKEIVMSDPQKTASSNSDDQYQIILNRLLDLFSELFRTPKESIDIHSPFLEMGADSLVLLSGARIIDDNFGVKIEIRQFFEEVKTIDAIAHYLKSFNVNTPSQLSTPEEVKHVGEVVNSIPLPSAQQTASPLAMPNLAPVNPLPAMSSANASDLSQLIFAQTQLMSQHLALMQTLGSSQPPVPSNPTMPVLAKEPIHQAAKTTQASTAAKPVTEDRSSPLRALNIPITPSTGNLNAQQSDYLNKLIDSYQRKTPKSKALAQSSRKGLADSRASIGFRFSTKEILYPITGIESSGSHIKDVDGNDYIDLTMGFGVLLFGSRPEFLRGLLEHELELGFQLGPRSVHMDEITTLFTEITGHDRVAFTNSGTEAVMIALRLARAATGRDKIVIFEGAYNGHSDGTLAKTTRVNGEFISEPVAPGVPSNIAKDVLVLEYGTPETLEIIRQHAHELAGVLVEPVQSRRLDFQPFEFLKQLRKITEESNVALIFDEMVSGFRAHPAGVQGLIGVKADIATYGKILGGGLPIGAVAGSSRFLDGIDGGFWQYGDTSYPRATRTYFGGTFCQHPFSMATCLATLRKLKAEGPELQEKLTQKTVALAKTLNTFFELEQIPMKVIQFSSTFQFKFSGNLEMFYYQLLEKGVYIWEWRACFLSTAHTDQDIEDLIKIVKETVFELRNAGFIPQASNSVATPSALVQPTNSSVAKEEPSERAWFRSQSKLSHNETLATVDQISDLSANSLDVGIFYFGNYNAADSAGKYQLLMDGARYADANGFSSVWIPERHFDQFGGFSPNPSVLAAAIAMQTQNIQICAGSVVAPLHDPIRIAEEWSVVDNLSKGRVGISFASGWHPNDFVFSPESFGDNRNLMFENIQTVRKLWEGESIERKGGNQSNVTLKTYPRPQQNSLPCWLTVVNNPDSYRKAGELGMHILTNMMGQSLADLENNIQIYKAGLASHGHDPKKARITVLIHAYLNEDPSIAIEDARQPMCDYLLSSINLFQKMAEGLGPVQDINRASQADKEFIVNKAYEKYVATSALIGSPKSVEPIVNHMLKIGVSELACFIDFGVDATKVINSLPQIKQLKDHYQAVLTQKKKSFPLGEAQKQLWLLAQLNREGNLAYNDPAAIRLKGPLDISALEKAINLCIHQHESLRTTIDSNGEEQHVQDCQKISLDLLDLRKQVNPKKSLNEWFLAQANKPFKLDEYPLFKATLIQIGDGDHVLALSSHHIITDGPSMGVALHEIVKNYALLNQGLSVETKPSIQYRDFINWQQTSALQKSLHEDESYWLEQFSQSIPELELPYDFPRPVIKTYNGARAWSEIEPSLLKGLQNVAGKNGATLYMILFAAFSTLLHRLSHQNKMAIGAPYTGRSMPGSESLVGYCVHLLPIVSKLNPADSFITHLKNTRQILLSAYDHQDYPFARLLDKLNLQRDISRAPLINAVFNLERLEEAQSVNGLLVEMHPQPIAFTRMDLTLTANLKGGKISLECDYNVDLFKSSTIDGFLSSYLNILETIVQSPEISLMDIPLVNPTNGLIQLKQWNGSQRKPESPDFVSQLEKTAQSQPDKIALVSQVSGNEISLTYLELNERANQLAHHLISLNLSVDEKVGICLTRSWQMVVALLACLKSRTAYLPLDPKYPEKRLTYLIENSQIKLLITDRSASQTISFPKEKTCFLDQQFKKIDSQSTANPNVPFALNNLAYVIYTSGSSGKPKGTMITYEGFNNYLNWAKKAYHADEGDGSPVIGSFSFDATITSIFVPLMSANKVVLLPEGEELEALCALNRSPYEYSFIKITPAHLELLNSLRETDKLANPSLTKMLVLGGEALLSSTVNPWLIDQKTTIINEYGPTETVVGCCIFGSNTPLEGTIPIGKPITGMRLYVLDDHLQLLPSGVPGDLYIGGIGLGRGYLNSPSQTATAFTPDPFSAYEESPGARLYKTGDRAFHLPNGDLVFLGRKDKQIKLNGYRIEIGEIEAALTQIPNIKEVAVVLRENNPGNTKLTAYFVSSNKAILDISDLRLALRDLLPVYMIPSAFVQLDEMPLSSHGKIDFTSLPAPAIPSHLISTNSSPSSKTEELIIQAWCEVLGCETIQKTDNFFDIGGNSLLILQVFKKIEGILPKNCQVIDLFKYPTIETLVTYVSDEVQDKNVGAEKIIERAAKQKLATLNKANRKKVGSNKARLNQPLKVE